MTGKPLWRGLVAWGFGLGFIPLISAGAVIEVGPGKKYSKPSEAVRVAGDGDVIEITGGTYMHDVAVWEQDGLTIRGVGGRAHLKADGAAAEEKAIWVIKGNNTTSLTLSDERVVREFGEISSGLDWAKPMFIYVNLQPAHFPYYYPACPSCWTASSRHHLHVIDGGHRSDLRSISCYVGSVCLSLAACLEATNRLAAIKKTQAAASI